MLITGIKSKPVYAPLRADTGGRHHVMLAVDTAAVAIERVLDELAAGSPGALARTRILCVGDAASWTRHPVLEVRSFPDIPALLADCRRVLDGSLMGTRLYVAGPESFIGRALQLALQFNLNQDEIRAEELGSAARRVHCVHCRTVAEDVHTNIVRCPGCDRWLLVRDHYSRRLAAYMGVMVDAEVPGELPSIQEIYR